MNPSKNTPPVSPYLVIFFGILAVSTASIFIRFAQTEASSLVIAAYRLSLATVVLAPVALRGHAPALRALTRRDLALGTLSGALLGLHFATWITSLELTSVASSVVLVTTTPLWVALLAPFTVQEPLHRRVLGGLGIALAGGAVVSLSDSCSISTAGMACPGLAQMVQGQAFLGNFLALAGAWAAAGYILIGRNLRAKLSIVPYAFMVYGIAAVVLVGIMLGFGESPVGYSPRVYGWFVLLALIPQLIGHSSFNWALGYLPAAFVSITLLGEPIGSILLAFVILQETPTWLNLIGAGLILAGIYVASNGDR